MRKWRRFVGLAITVIVVGATISLIGQGRAIAQAVRAALVQNVDEPGRNAYSESASCFSFGCLAIFSPVPAGKRLVVTFINGQVGSGSLTLDLGGHRTDNNVRAFLATSNLINAPTLAYFDAGEAPYITANAPGNFTQATLSGYYINQP